jgi:uncharacterized protein
MSGSTGSNIKTGSNRLANEKSPYLLQHSLNPVNWYPWSDEAFDKAHREDKPIFLSIGYSTCHWCHVMEHESFEDEQIAGLMNDLFVSIKVDREERPDIDNIYMTVCQILTGSGGWPLTILMTPDKKPFYAATYIPKESRYGQVGMLELIPRIKEIWQKRRSEVLKSANQVIEALEQSATAADSGELGEPILTAAYEEFRKNFDQDFGGFGAAPKFPAPHNFLFLLRYWKRTGEATALEMIERTLQAMRLGGIHDHLGFGFHRYSTDIQWRVPHFEKMLYDQALMAIAYIETYQATGKSEYKEVAKEIFAYITRDLTDPKGAFYSAEDADSDGVEGKFYLWTEEEIRTVLSPEDSDLVIRLFNIKQEGNFGDDSKEQKTSNNILYLSKPISVHASDMRIPLEELSSQIERARADLVDYRNKRVHPHKDDKILTDWNGLMVAAFSLGAQILEEPRYAEIARRAVNFILGNLRAADGRLLHRYRDGQAAMQANLDDYAFLIWGLLNLYETTFDVRYLRDALELNGDMLDHFWDDHEGGLHFTADDAEELPIRQKEIYDGAIPSGNSVAALNLIRLGRITGNVNYEMMAERICNIFSSQVRRAPQAFTMLLSAFDYALGPSWDIVIVGRTSAEDTKEMLKAIRSKFIPNKIIIVRPSSQDSPELVHFADFIRHQTSIHGHATAYICRNYSCEMPTTDVSKMMELLEGKES